MRRRPDYPRGGLPPHIVGRSLPSRSEPSGVGATGLPARGEVPRPRSGRGGGGSQLADYTPRAMDASISVARIEEAARMIDPVFRDTPQFVCEPLSDPLGVTTILNIETINPIRSFKGRGTDYLLHRLGPQPNGI